MTGEVGGTNSLPNAKAQDEARGVSAVNINFKGPEGSFEMSTVLSGVEQGSEGRGVVGAVSQAVPDPLPSPGDLLGAEPCPRERRGWLHLCPAFF